MSTITSSRTDTVTITRTFHAPLAAVWQAWTLEDEFKKWWGPKGYTCPSATLDVRPSGTSIMAMRDADGKTTWGTSAYLEVVPEKRLVYVDNFSDANGTTIPAADAGMTGDWSNELLVTITFSEEEGATVMHLKHEGLPPEQVEDCTQGWGSSFDKMEEALEAA